MASAFTVVLLDMQIWFFIWYHTPNTYNALRVRKYNVCTKYFLDSIFLISFKKSLIAEHHSYNFTCQKSLFTSNTTIFDACIVPQRNIKEIHNLCIWCVCVNVSLSLLHIHVIQESLSFITYYCFMLDSYCFSNIMSLNGNV